VLTGSSLQKLTSALLAAYHAGASTSTKPLPPAYTHYRSSLGHLLYGPSGYDIPRSDQERFKAAQSRNYTFFEAPVGIVLCMDRSLAEIDVFGSGMYLQTVSYLLAERGVATCYEASIAGYGEVVKKTLGLGEEMEVLVGVAVGYEDEGSSLNKIEFGREPVEKCVEFRD
jgi:hypothetical protein